MDILIWILVELVMAPVLEFLFRPLGWALRSSLGGVVLAGIWVVSGGWFWAGWQLGMTGKEGFPMGFAVFTVLGAPALALISTLCWAGRLCPRRG